MTVELLTVADCHLCETAAGVVAEVCAAAGVEWSMRDLFALGDEDVRRWRDLVPVLLVDGRVVDTLRIDPGRLRGVLSAAG